MTVGVIGNRSNCWQIPTDPKLARRQSKSKPGQANPNKNVWICLVLFVRIRTYQWVAAIPNKIFPLAVRVLPVAPSFRTSAMT
jgi:hypothetical protein